MCKWFYINSLLVEVGVFSNSNTEAYSKVDLSKEDLINAKRKYCFNFGMIVIDKQKDLSIMFSYRKCTNVQH